MTERSDETLIAFIHHSLDSTFHFVYDIISKYHFKKYKILF